MICRRVAIINQGRLLAIDSPSGLQRASEQTNRVLLTASAPVDALRTELLSVAGVSAVIVHPVPGIEDMLNVECQTDAREGVEVGDRASSGRPLGSASSGTPAADAGEHFSALREPDPARETPQ